MSDDRDNVIHVTFGSRRSKRVEPTSSGSIEAPPESAPDVARAEAPPDGARDRAIDPMIELYSTAEVSRLFGVPASRLRYWNKSGFLAPSGRSGRRHLYTFGDLVGIRTAKGLLDQGVPLRRVRRAVEALRQSLPRVTRPLNELRIVADGQSVVVRSDARAFEPTTGQLVLDFEVEQLRDEVVRVLRSDARATSERRAAYEYYLEGCRLDEEEATFDRAEAAYRRAIDLDPSLGNALTNLGNLRFRRGSVEDAERLYTRALHVDPEQSEALYNMGFIVYERGEVEAAAIWFRRALASDPAFADAHFNLAMALEELGAREEAREHWSTYLRLDPTSAWADIARRHLTP